MKNLKSSRNRPSSSEDNPFGIPPERQHLPCWTGEQAQALRIEFKDRLNPILLDLHQGRTTPRAAASALLSATALLHPHFRQQAQAMADYWSRIGFGAGSDHAGPDQIPPVNQGGLAMTTLFQGVGAPPQASEKASPLPTEALSPPPKPMESPHPTIEAQQALLDAHGWSE